MKNIKYLSVVGLALTLGLTACSPEFLDRKPTTAIDSKTALSTVSNVQAGTNGLMLYFATSGYAGRNLPVIGDLIADNITTSAGNSGHLLDIEVWNISSSISEVGTFWNGSYQVISAAAKVVEACEKLSVGAKENDKKTLNLCKAAALTVKVYAEYVLTQYYCLPYSAANSVQPFAVPGPENMNGIILVPKNKPVAPEDAIDSKSTLKIATLAETYAHMHDELKDAIELFGKDKNYISSNAAYFPTKCMALTLQARLYLEQGYHDASNFQKAYDAATQALTELPSGAKAELLNDSLAFMNQYRTINAPTSEDILTVNFTAQDNLSANSINNFFGSYGCRVSSAVTGLFKGNDFRQTLYLGSEKDEKKEIYSSCGKYPNKDQINNVPVLRVPELYLIQAEARANITNSVDDPQYKDAMMATLGRRDYTIKDYEDLKERYFNSTSDGNVALEYVLEERRREFVAEGHRWSDLRRTKSLLTRSNSDFRIKFTKYPIYAFAFPIPESETNTGAWKGGILGAGTRGQNEAWKANGDSWSPVYILPTDGGADYNHD